MIIWPAPIVGADPVYASLEGLLLGAEDEFGTTIHIEDDAGWYGSAGVRRPGRQDRPGRDGVFSSPGLSDGLAFTLSGKAFGTDTASVAQTIRAMRATLSTGDKSGVLSWFDPDESVVLSSLVERDSEWRIRWIADRGFEWQVSLFAPDPRRYAEPQSVSTGLPGGGVGLAVDFGGDLFDSGTLGSLGTMTVTNTGTAPTEPTFTVTGPMGSGFELSHLDTGRRITYPHPVVADTVVDCSEGAVTSGGQDRTGLLSRDEFFTIGPGETAVFQFSTLGGETFADPCTATCTASPAYT